MIEPNRYYGNYRGIVIQNNDPLYAGRVKIFVPAVNANLLEGWVNNFKEDETVNHVGSNVGGFSEEIILKLKKVLPWSGTSLPLFGMGSNGFYFSPKHQSILSNDSNQSGQQKKNLEDSCKNETMQKDFSETGSTAGRAPVQSVGSVVAQGTIYGYPSDPNKDSNSAKGIGNRGNQLNSSSVAISQKTADALGIGIKSGASIKATFPDGKTGIYRVDDTIPPDYSNHRIDFFHPTNSSASSFPYNGSNVVLEKANQSPSPVDTSTGLPQEQPDGPDTTLFDNTTIPPTYVENNTCNQGSGGVAPQSNNNMDTQNYTGNSGMDGQTKTTYGNDTYRNPNDVSGRNSTIPDLTLQTRPPNHSNNWKGMISIPAVGSHVWCFFEGGDPHLPVAFGYHANQEAFLGVHGIVGFDKTKQILA
jgi:hypothetical protein